VGLQTFHLRRRLFGYEPGLDHLVFPEKIGLIDRQILDDRQIGQRLDDDRLAGIHILHQDRAGKAVLAVDPHTVGAAHSVRARAPERQRTIYRPLDLMQRIEHAERRVYLVKSVVGKVRLRVLLRIVSLDSECCGHQKTIMNDEL